MNPPDTFPELLGALLDRHSIGQRYLVDPGPSDVELNTLTEAALRALKPRFDLYARANRINAHPGLVDLLIWRAQRSPRLLRRMSGVLEETSNPGHLVTLRGLWRLFAE